MAGSRSINDVLMKSQNNINNVELQKQKSKIVKKKGKFNKMFNTTPEKKQMYLDFGQKSFGKRKYCKDCGMMYTKGEEEDEKEHIIYCRRQKKGILLSEWKNERLVHRIPSSQARIIEIRSSDPKLHVSKLQEIKHVMDESMGYASNAISDNMRYFVYIIENQVVGCVAAEAITHGFRLETCLNNNNNNNNSYDNLVGSIVCSNQKKEALLGINQLWVNPSFQGKHIATSLIDILRSKFIYNVIISKEKVAFSQPTEKGVQFARKYLQPFPVLLYQMNIDQ